MKKLLIFALFLGLHTAVMAQESSGLKKNESVYSGVLGPSNLAGINYDIRFNDHTRFGWRAGLSFGYGHNSSIFWEGSGVYGYTVPLRANCPLGSQKNDLGVGMSASVGIYNIHGIFMESVDGPKSSLSANQQEYAVGEYNTPEGTKTWLAYNKGRNKSGYCFFGNIGYRHVSNEGFLFRAGFSPSFTIGEKSAVKRAFFYPYLGPGWAF